MDRPSDRHHTYDDLSDPVAGCTPAAEFSDGPQSERICDANSVDPARVMSEDDVAVIGIAIKFPEDATSTESFWSMLMHRRSALSDVPKDRYNVDAFWSPDALEPGTVRHAILACVTC